MGNAFRAQGSSGGRGHPSSSERTLRKAAGPGVLLEGDAGFSLESISNAPMAHQGAQG